MLENKTVSSKNNENVSTNTTTTDHAVKDKIELSNSYCNNTDLQQGDKDLDLLDANDIPDIDFDIITNQIDVHDKIIAKLPSLHELVSMLLFYV